MLTNEELMTSFKIRRENFGEVQRLLSEINQTLFKAQRLRGEKEKILIFNIFCIKHFYSVGQLANKMMGSYKEALEQKNIEKLIQIMEISG